MNWRINTPKLQIWLSAPTLFIRDRCVYEVDEANATKKPHQFEFVWENTSNLALYSIGTTRNDMYSPPDILSVLLSVSETDTSWRSLDHERKAWCIDSGQQILGQHWSAVTGFLPFLPVVARAWALFLGVGLINSRSLCASLGGIAPPHGAHIGQTKAFWKVEPMMGINGWEMSTNLAVYHTGGHVLDTCCFMWTEAFKLLPDLNLGQQAKKTKQMVMTFSANADNSGIISVVSWLRSSCCRK